MLFGSDRNGGARKSFVLLPGLLICLGLAGVPQTLAGDPGPNDDPAASPLGETSEILPRAPERVRPRDGECDARATAYADAHLGSGDPTGELIDRAMDGAVEGYLWAGPRGARRGARVEGGKTVLDTLSSYPGGWQALYDMAYQICIQEPDPDCRSQAGMVGSGAASGQGLSARSGCR